MHNMQADGAHMQVSVEVDTAISPMLRTTPSSGSFDRTAEPHHATISSSYLYKGMLN
jgi:hypothetical protein